MADDAVVFYDPDGGYTIQVNLGLAFAEDVLNILGSYDEYAGDKIDVIQDYPQEYDAGAADNIQRLRETARALYSILTPVYSEAVATTVYGPEDDES